MIDRSQLQDPRQFYEAVLAPAHLTRPNRKGWALSCCPSHKSKSKRSFAVNVQTGAFHCFGCDLHGPDIISFVMQVQQCSFQRAKQILGLSEPATEAERQQIAAAHRDRQLKQEQAAAAAHQARQERLQLRDEVHALSSILRTAEEHLDADPQNENWWAVAAAAFEQLRTAELEYLQQCGFSEEQL